MKRKNSAHIVCCLGHFIDDMVSQRVDSLENKYNGDMEDDDLDPVFKQPRDNCKFDSGYSHSLPTQ